ncbi:transcriptional regulator, LysR family [Palleronia salina]|uniref:Transcriptional regulator, LysR family n=1 Tax=Palleronia salina TaxID=313368 RepID=A0A1M6EUJ8_9RHOB|nr:LysR family transcriptional regulator [Palleronia salina]SHI89050.1 transcriptional regulator, LysR family [Palleronia salina]
MKNLNLDQLRTFLFVVNHGGVNRAAKLLNLSQPAVTARIKGLERTLGKALFQRTPTGLRPTRDGEILFRHAERFEHLASLVERDIVDPRTHEGYLRIGASETVTQTWLPDLVSRLHRDYPALMVEITVDISPDLRRSLLEREIDLAFLLGPISEPSVDNIALPAFDLAWYVAADAVPPNGDPASHLTRPVITYLRQTRPFRELRATLIDLVGPGVRIFTSSSLSACFRLVEAGLGVAALPRAMGAPYVASGNIVEFDPGWHPAPLQFTASWVAEPPDPLAAMVARLALEVA